MANSIIVYASVGADGLGLGYRPDLESYSAYSHNLRNGSLVGLDYYLGSTKPYEYLVTHEGANLEGVSWYSSLGEAVVSPFQSFGDWRSRYESAIFNLYIRLDGKVVKTFKGIYIERKEGVDRDVLQGSDVGILEVEDAVDSNSTYVVSGSSAYVDISFYEVADPEVSNVSMLAEGAKLDIASLPSSVSDEFKVEVENVNTDIEYSSLLNTWHTPKSERKYLTEVSNPVDVFVDTDSISLEEAKTLSDTMSSHILPYQYSEGGDLHLNPNGGVLLADFIKKNGIFDTYPDTEVVKGGLGVVDKWQYVTYFQAVLMYLHVKGVEFYDIQPTSVLINLFRVGLQGSIYPIEVDSRSSIRYRVTGEELFDALLLDVRDAVPLSDLSVLLLVVSKILELDLFNSNAEGIPRLSSRISRLALAELWGHK